MFACEQTSGHGGRISINYFNGVECYYCIVLFHTARTHFYCTYLQVVGANPEGPNVPDEQRVGKLFPPGALPKLQSFKAAISTDKTKLLIVGGRYNAQTLYVLVITG